LSLWGDVLDKYPDAATAYNNRGEFFMSQAEYSKALANFYWRSTPGLNILIIPSISIIILI